MPRDPTRRLWSPRRLGGLGAPQLAAAILLPAAFAAADDWPQWRGPQRDGVWREEGIADALPEKLPRRWSTPVGSGYAGPAVAAGRVFVTDRALERGEANPSDPFARSAVRGKERVLALSAETGEVLWTHEYPAEYTISYPYGPRATPTVDGDVVYTTGAMGDLHALEAATGRVLWALNTTRRFGAEINTWGVAAAPLADGRKLVVLAGGSGGACVVALDKRTGAEIWRAMDCGDPGYAPPVIFTAGGTRQLVVWNPDAVHALDPETGKLLWKEPFEVTSGLSVATPIHDPERSLLFVTAFYNGPLLLELSRERPEATLRWRGGSQSERETDGLHGLMCTPHLDRGYIYGVCSYGQLRCLEAATGRRVWETLEATGSGRWWNAFLIRHRNREHDRYVIANEQGELIFAHLSPRGYEEISRTFLIEPTRPVRRRLVVWSHPAFADRCVFARNDKEIICASLARREE